MNKYFSHKLPMNVINVDNVRVKAAINFVEEEIGIWLKQYPVNFIKSKVEKIPWIYYTPAYTIDDIRERDTLIEEYKTSQPRQLQYYLLYHGCDEFAIFYWTSLSVNGIMTNIVCQEIPFRHTYLQSISGEIIDALLSHCHIAYPHQPDTAKIFDTHHDFYADIFISKINMQDWEIELLNHLKTLE